MEARSAWRSAAGTGELSSSRIDMTYAPGIWFCPAAMLPHLAISASTFRPKQANRAAVGVTATAKVDVLVRMRVIRRRGLWVRARANYPLLLMRTAPTTWSPSCPRPTTATVASAPSIAVTSPRKRRLSYA